MGEKYLFASYPLLLEGSADCNDGNIDIKLLFNEINHFFMINMW